MNTNAKNICLDCATAGISQEITEAGRCTCCGTVAPATIEPREFWETKEQFIARAMTEQKAFETALVAAAPVDMEVAEEVPAKAPKKARCPHYEVIRQFAALARELGLNMKEQDRARGAMGVYLGVKIESRAQLTAAQWRNAMTGLRAGVLFW